MWKFKEIKQIIYCGFPDGDYPVFVETKNGKETGKKDESLAMRHYSLGSDFLNFMGVTTYKEYQKLKGKRVYIEHTDDGMMTVSMKDLNGDWRDFEVEGVMPPDSDEIDWDNEFAKDIGQSV